MGKWMVGVVGMVAIISCGGPQNKSTVTSASGHAARSMIIGVGGAVIPTLQKGETLQWIPQGGAAPVPVTFYSDALCQEGKTNVQTCTVKGDAPDGVYVYNCQGCADPGVAMGSDTVQVLQAGTRAAAAVNGHLSQVYCPSSAQAAASPVTGNAGDTLQWVPAPGVTGFTITAVDQSTQTPLCSNGPTYNGPNGYCAMNGKAGTYTVQAKCNGSTPTGTGTISLPQ